MTHITIKGKMYAYSLVNQLIAWLIKNCFVKAALHEKYQQRGLINEASAKS